MEWNISMWMCDFLDALTISTTQHVCILLSLFFSEPRSRIGATGSKEEGVEGDEGT